MTDFNPCTLAHSVDLIRRKALIRHFECETAFARQLHYNFLEKLDAMRADLDTEITTWIELNRNRNRSDEDAFQFELYYIRTDFEHRWIDEGPHSVLDEINILAQGYEPGEVCPVKLAHTNVPASELEGLDELFAQVKHDMGVTIKAARLIRSS